MSGLNLRQGMRLFCTVGIRYVSLPGLLGGRLLHLSRRTPGTMLRLLARPADVAAAVVVLAAVAPAVDAADPAAVDQVHPVVVY